MRRRASAWPPSSPRGEPGGRCVAVTAILAFLVRHGEVVLFLYVSPTSWGSRSRRCRSCSRRVSAHAERVGESFGVALAAVIAAYVVFKWIQRQRWLRSLRIARVSAEEPQSLARRPRNASRRRSPHVARCEGGAVRDSRCGPRRRRGPRAATS